MCDVADMATGREDRDDGPIDDDGNGGENLLAAGA